MRKFFKDNIIWALLAAAIIGILTYMLLHYYDQFLSIWTGNLKRIVNLWQNFLRVLPCGVKVDIHDRTDYLRNTPVNLCHIIISFYY